MMTPKRPTLCIVAGPNGSGKTTMTTQLLRHEWTEGSVYINPGQHRAGAVRQLLFRMTDGRVQKRYVSNVPAWAQPLSFPELG